MSYISTDNSISGPRSGTVWRDKGGTIHGTVYFRAGANYMSFDDPADVRAVIAALTETLEAMERLEAEGTERKGGSDE